MDTFELKLKQSLNTLINEKSPSKLPEYVYQGKKVL